MHGHGNLIARVYSASPLVRLNGTLKCYMSKNLLMLLVLSRNIVFHRNVCSLLHEYNFANGSPKYITIRITYNARCLFGYFMEASKRAQSQGMGNMTSY